METTIMLEGETEAARIAERIAWERVGRADRRAACSLNAEHLDEVDDEAAC